jgi:flagellar motor protein MotB
MKRIAGSALVAVLALGALTSIGCNDQDKKNLAALQSQYNDLSNQNKQLRDELAKSKATESELTAQLDAKDMELAKKNEQISELQKKGGSAAAPAAGAQNWEVGLTGDRVTVGADILFASGKAALTKQGEAALAKIAKDLKTSYAGMTVRVYGYTDNEAIHKTKNLWQDNLDLSANRAMAVTRYLISQGVKADLIETVDMGETHPAAPNTSSANKQKNRRVEIIVIKTGK